MAEATVKRDRAAAVVMAVLVGDALGMGSHWIYDLDEFKKLHGWQTGYVKPTSYHKGRNPGQLTMPGELTSYFVRTLATSEGWDREHFTDQFDAMLRSPGVDGTRTGGRWGWTEKDTCDVYKRRVMGGKPWGPETASPAGDTTTSIIRAAVCAARWYDNLPKMIEVIREQTLLQYRDVGVLAQSICFGCVIAAIINGHPLDEDLSDYLYASAQEGQLPFTFLRGDRDNEDGLAEPDGLLMVSSIFHAANDAAIGANVPAHLGVQLYGQACAWFMCLPSAYFVASKSPRDFETAVLNSLNAGGQNVARTSLVGALVAAEVGLAGIPQRFLAGLEDSDAFLAMAHEIAARNGR